MNLFSNIWRHLAVIGGVLVIICGFIWRLLTLGAQRERAKQNKARLEAVRQRKEVDDEVGSLNNDAAADQLRGWLRD